MKFVKVENGVVIETYSGFPIPIGKKKYGSNTPLVDLRKLGVYPLEETANPAITDDRAEKLSEINYDIQTGKVIASRAVVAKPQSEIDSDIAAALVRLRGLIGEALRDSDWTQLPDAPLTQGKKDEWVAYRQQLRDIPNNLGSMHPDDALLPTPPTQG